MRAKTARMIKCLAFGLLSILRTLRKVVLLNGDKGEGES